VTMPVKICGITRFEDAALAAQLGAASVGFVFWSQSPRFIEPDAAAEILAAIPPHVAGIGVFVDQPSKEINAIADRVGLGAVQLHGSESMAQCARCRRRVIKAVRLSADSTTDAVDDVWPEATVLLDAFDPVRMGGTGRQIDWALAARIARQRRTILSGGLRADNVGEAMRRVTPYGLDVSSGVESRPGFKAPELMRAFFDAVTQATGPMSPASGAQV